MRSIAAIHLASLRESVGYVAVPEKHVPPACKNCGHYTCDADDREGRNGLYLERSNSRCLKHGFPVNRLAVCDSHQFRYKDKRDV